MDKILVFLGTVFFVAVVKVRAALESVIEGMQGEYGFLLMLGICGAALLGSVIVFSWSSRKRRETA